VLQSELKVITDLQKEWDDAFAHWNVNRAVPAFGAEIRKSICRPV
jgi:hypothetical protein